jgi:hypothetical protein
VEARGGVRAGHLRRRAGAGRPAQRRRRRRDPRARREDRDRHYDRAKGGEQAFQWAAQDLYQPLSSPDDQQASINLRRELPVRRADGSTISIREYRQLERIPTPNGLFTLEFDVWTDDAERPIAYRINKVQDKPPVAPIVAIRRGYEDLRAEVVGASH